MNFLKQLFAKEGFHRETAQKDKVTLTQKLAIGMGEIPGIGHKTIENLALPIFNLALGVNPVLITVVLGLARFWDAITDPMAGSISDNTHTKWGRRRPYLFVASIMCGISLALVFMGSSEWSQTAIFVYFLILALIFYTSYSFFNIPLVAIAWEATPDYHERTRIMAYKIFFSNINSIMATWLLAIATWSIFSSTLQGARVTSWIVAVIMVVFGLIPAYLVKEGNYKIALKEKRLNFVASVRETFKNKPFMIFLGITLVRDLPSVMVSTLGLYVSIFYVFGGDIKYAAVYAGVAGTITQLLTMGILPILTRIVTRTSKKRMLGINLFALMIITGLGWLAYDPRWPWGIVVHAVLMAPPMTMVSMIMHSMIADVCDYDEYLTGSRREGIYASIYAWVGKAMGSFSIMLSGGVLVWIGFNQALPEQSDSTLLYMRLIFILAPIIAIAGSLFFVRIFPLTEEKTFEVREELERRRGAEYVR